MKVYIAAPYSKVDAARGVKIHLEALGLEVTSRWLVEYGEENTHAAAQMDLDDVAAADLLLLLNFKEWLPIGGGGRHVEFGYALALNKRLVVFGVRSHVFHHMSHVRVIERLEDL